MSNFSLISAFLILSVVGICFSSPQPYHGSRPDKLSLKFKISARDLKDKDFFRSDPYVSMYYTENEGTSESKFGKSEWKSNTINPDWSDTFTFEFDRFKRQRWHFIVKDHDLLSRNDKIGQVWVSVQDFVDNDQYLQVNLQKQGYLIIKKV